MIKKRSFWINLCLVNLFIVAFFGLALRSKILFPIPFINYRYFLSAHSHFAFGGWAGLSLITLLIYDILPASQSDKKVYQWILWGIEISSLGMAISFPFFGYNAVSVFFSSLYIFVYFFFAWVFIKDLLKIDVNKYVRLLCVSAIASLIISSLGPLGISYILISGSGNSILYRDSIYFFLHFQYNGFFTLSIFALFFQYLSKKRMPLSNSAIRFANYLCLSVVPALFLSLLWHNLVLFYVLAAIGCLLILLSLFYFARMQQQLNIKSVLNNSTARLLLLFAFLSFGVKMALNVGTIFPGLGNAVYGARPVIIGFLHLVFLGFLSFYILSVFIEDGLFASANGKVLKYPFIVFPLGIMANETLLMLQGLSILLKTNSFIYNWLLLAASILLFGGAALIMIARLRLRSAAKADKK